VLGSQTGIAMPQLDRDPAIHFTEDVGVTLEVAVDTGRVRIASCLFWPGQSAP